MFKICCKAEKLVANAAEDVSAIGQESSDNDDTTHNNIETATATVTINEVGEEISRSIPPSIAEATLVGARLRHYQHNQQQGDEHDDNYVGNTYPSHRHNNKKHIDIDLLDWDELPDTMKEAALTLGCDSQMWDSGEESAQCELFWSDLTDEEQKAAMVLGYQSTSWDEDDDNAKENSHIQNSYSEDNASHQNANPNNVAGQCHWGKMGCNKGTSSWNANSASSKINATPGNIGNNVDDNDDDSVTTHQSSLAGSATAKIEAYRA